MRGTGKADIFVMLAHPVGHAKSPGIFNQIFEERGLDSLMVPLTCAPQISTPSGPGWTPRRTCAG